MNWSRACGVERRKTMEYDIFGLLALSGLFLNFGGGHSGRGFSPPVTKSASVADYSLRESNGVLFDLSGNGHDGVMRDVSPSEGAGRTPNFPGGASGGAGYGQIPNRADLNFANRPFSIEARFQASAAPNGTIVSKSQAGTTGGYTLGIANGLLSFGGSQALTAPMIWQAGSLYEVVAESNGDGTGALFVNGSQVGFGAYADIWNDSGPLILGANSGGGQRFNGILNEITLYDHALTAAQIKANSVPKTPAPSAFWVAAGGAIPGWLLLRRKIGSRPTSPIRKDFQPAAANLAAWKKQNLSL